MLFKDEQNEKIAACRDKLTDARSANSNFWLDSWNGDANTFEETYDKARSKQTPQAWQAVCDQGRQLRDVMRESADDPHHLPRYFTAVGELTDCIENALQEAQKDGRNYVPQTERGELLDRVEKLEILANKEREHISQTEQDLQAKLDEAKNVLEQAKKPLINIKALNNITVKNDGGINITVLDVASVVALIKDALEAIKHGVDLLNDKRFTKPLRKGVRKVWRATKRFVRKVRARFEAFKFPWKKSEESEYFEGEEPDFGFSTELNDQEAESPPPGTIIQDAPFAPELVVIPPGKFMMGSPKSEERWSGYDGREEPQHEVTIPKPFAVARYAITFEEWDYAVAQGACDGYRPKDQGWGRGRRPVINVSWDDAQAYVRWLSEQTGHEYRLLTEAEWEYCCRAGTSTPFSWGSSISTDQANYDGNYTYSDGVKGKYRRQTVPVDDFSPNPWGLYQMHGNVWEWVADHWHDNYDGAPSDGSSWVNTDGSDNSLRVLRGGSWDYLPQILRSAVRLRYDRGIRFDYIGFRITRTLR